MGKWVIWREIKELLSVPEFRSAADVLFLCVLVTWVPTPCRLPSFPSRSLSCLCGTPSYWVWSPIHKLFSLSSALPMCFFFPKQTSLYVTGFLSFFLATQDWNIDHPLPHIKPSLLVASCLSATLKDTLFADSYSDFGYFRPENDSKCVEQPELKGHDLEFCLYGREEHLTTNGWDGCFSHIGTESPLCRVKAASLRIVLSSSWEHSRKILSTKTFCDGGNVL